jgi:hypothetical protein
MEKRTQRSIEVSNSMIVFLNAQELEAFAEAEQTYMNANETKAKMFETIKARKLCSWLESISEEEGLLHKLIEHPEKAKEIMNEEELVRFTELNEIEDQAERILLYFYRVVADRAQIENGGGKLL